MATAVQQAPLGIQDSRLVLARVQASDRQQYLYIRVETGRRRGQHHALAVQAPGELAHQQLVDIRRKATGPTTVGRRTQAAVGLTLQERLTLQVIGNRYRAEHHGHARTLRRLARITTVELVQGNRLVHGAPAKAQQASHQQRKWKAQKFHHPIQAVADRPTAVIHVDSNGHTATPAPQGPYHPRNNRPTPAFLPGTTLKLPFQTFQPVTPALPPATHRPAGTRVAACCRAVRARPCNAPGRPPSEIGYACRLAIQVSRHRQSQPDR
ncbi:hypothetical protein D3C72_684300 [compost metagenome]